MEYKVIIGDKEFIINSYVLKLKKCIITNMILNNNELKFDCDEKIFKVFIFPILNGLELEIKNITDYMNELYRENFNAIIDYINFDVVPLFKYFLIYNKSELKNHVKSLNNLDNYLCGIYQIRNMTATVKSDLNEVSSENRVTSFIYSNLTLREYELFDHTYQIIKEIVCESKLKYSTQLINYYCVLDHNSEYNNNYFSDENDHSDFYSALVKEIESIDNKFDRKYLYKWICELIDNDYDCNDVEENTDLKLDVIIELINKYSILNNYQLFSSPYFNDILDGLTYYRCITIVVYSDN